MKILAFETSCDETSAAVVDGLKVLSNVTHTQLEHADFGGVVPEIASRAQIRLIWPITRKALAVSGVGLDEIEGIAVTKGPGLIGSLLVGIVFAKTIAQLLHRPLIGVNHLEGHIFSAFISHPELKPPLLVLLVSGGHTELVWMADYFDYRLLGVTLDDAAGEAFDKVAKLLGLPYPGGPHIDRIAREGDPEFVNFPRARPKDFDFSFSGLKTAVLYYLRKQSKEFIEEHIADIAASFQEAVVDSLLLKTEKAVEQTGAEKLAVVGGVSLNSRLREKFRSAFTGKVELFFPEPQYCGDNAAMIGAAGHVRLEHGFRDGLDLTAYPNLQL